jgi:hypothetical protein
MATPSLTPRLYLCHVSAQLVQAPDSCAGVTPHGASNASGMRSFVVFLQLRQVCIYPRSLNFFGEWRGCCSNVSAPLPNWNHFHDRCPHPPMLVIHGQRLPACLLLSALMNRLPGFTGADPGEFSTPAISLFSEDLLNSPIPSLDCQMSRSPLH